MAQQIEEGKAPLTCRNYRDWLKLFLGWLGDRDALSLTADEIETYLAGVFREVQNPHTRFSRVIAKPLQAIARVLRQMAHREKA